jgi:hypothetical protein
MAQRASHEERGAASKGAVLSLHLTEDKEQAIRKNRCPVRSFFYTLSINSSLPASA